MGDKFSKEVRSRIMSRVRGKDTKPEVRLRKALHRMGYRYSLHKYFPEIRCRPDITIVSRRTVVFVDGCFWHKCPKHFRMPKSNLEYWEPKLARNAERDREKDAWFKESGWKVVRVWECEVHHARPKTPYLVCSAQKFFSTTPERVSSANSA